MPLSEEYSMVPENHNGPVFLSVIREIRCSGAAHHRIGDECLVTLSGRKYRMLHEDGTPEGEYKAGVTWALCRCGARWGYHSGGQISPHDQHFE